MMPLLDLNLGTAYQANNNLQKALAEYNKALQMDPKQVDAHYYLGTVYEALKQPGWLLLNIKNIYLPHQMAPMLPTQKNESSYYLGIDICLSWLLILHRLQDL